MTNAVIFPCRQNDYMQLSLFGGIRFLRITLTITTTYLYLITSRTDSPEL